jgi:ElaB/YqjD/DUF883 family membrane-anchored ribosome-binding protein
MTTDAAKIGKMEAQIESMNKSIDEVKVEIKELSHKFDLFIDSASAKFTAKAELTALRTEMRDVISSIRNDLSKKLWQTNLLTAFVTAAFIAMASYIFLRN